MTMTEKDRRCRSPRDARRDGDLRSRAGSKLRGVESVAFMGNELKGPEMEFPEEEGEHGDRRLEEDGPHDSSCATERIF